MKNSNRWLAFLLLFSYQSNQLLAYDQMGTFDLGSLRPEENPDRLQLWLTISAEKRFLEVSWKNAPAKPEDNILITKENPESFRKIEVSSTDSLTPLIYNEEGSGDPVLNTNQNNIPEVQGRTLSDFIDDDLGSGYPMNMKITYQAPPKPISSREFWITNNGRNDIVAAIKPSISSQWFTTGVPFDYSLSQNVTKNTNCYGYWASYINGTGHILAKACVRAYTTWMNDLRSVIGNLRFRDLFILGSHDSGSYRREFDPLLQENLLTKYALTQDDDIRGQLMHGVRYLDIRVGYYRNTPEMFFINHGITRQIPLIEVINQVKDFVLETNEIVIFGLKEFPVGFRKNLSVHHLLVSYLKEKFGDLIVHPSATWRATLNDIWSRQQNIIIAYDLGVVVREYPDILFTSVEQRWGNVQKWSTLQTYLKNINSFDPSRLSSRPVADMAEITPDTWGVVLDKYGGLRRLADRINWRVSQLYRDQLGPSANIVAVDFIRGTSLMDISLDYNKRKISF